MFIRFLKVLLLAFAAFAFVGTASAQQAEPTIKQVYDLAHSGQVEQARQAMQGVLREHPKSAKAHYVMAELEAMKGDSAQARDQLAQAEALAPGLPFAKPEAVQALRANIAQPPAPARRAAAAAAQEPRTPSFPWGLFLGVIALLAVVAVVLGRRAAAQRTQAAAAAAGGYGAPMGYGAQPYGPQPYGPQPGYGPAAPPQGGMGGNIMGGLATGLAVGAGALAAQEIGHRMLHGRDSSSLAGGTDAHSAASDSSLARDAGIGSIGGSHESAVPDNFGIADADSWDDGGGSSDGGDGGGWDS